MKWLWILLLCCLMGCPHIELPNDVSVPNVTTGKTATKTKLVVVSAPFCFWCERQKREFVDIDKEYAIQYLDMVKDAEQVSKWNLPPLVPITLIVEDDKIAHKFFGFTTWESVKPYADRAKLK